MKKFIKNLYILIVILVLTSCTNSDPEDLNSLIQTPKQDVPSIAGTRKVVEVDGEMKADKEVNSKVGDLIYICLLYTSPSPRD